jgi:hypothetical protein
MVKGSKTLVPLKKDFHHILEERSCALHKLVALLAQLLARAA